MIEQFDRIQALPEGFFELETSNIRNLFPNPTLIHLEGKDPNVLFISILLHGNEYTGLKAMQRGVPRVSSRCSSAPLATSMKAIP